MSSVVHVFVEPPKTAPSETATEEAYEPDDTARFMEGHEDAETDHEGDDENPATEKPQATSEGSDQQKPVPPPEPPATSQGSETASASGPSPETPAEAPPTTG